MLVEMQPNAQSSFQKLNVVNSCQKICKIRYYIFEVLPNFIVLLYSVPNILSRITWANIFGRGLAQSPSHLNFWTFSITSKHFSNHDKTIKQVSYVKSYKFNSFVLALFCILGLGQSLTLENVELCWLVVIWEI